MGGGSLKVKFLGYREGASAGCGVCAKKVQKSGKFKIEKRLQLASGNVMNFKFNQIYEVNETDGNYLLSEFYMYKGEKKYMFERVD